MWRLRLCLLALYFAGGDCRNAQAIEQVHTAIQKGDTVRLATLLVTDPSLLNIRDDEGQGPVWWAMQSEASPNLIGLLIALGSNITNEDRDKHGLRPLDYIRGGVTDQVVESWIASAKKAIPAIEEIKRLLIKQLEVKLRTVKALDEELDSYDD